MTRVSLTEMYDDKDVIVQILKLKDTLNDYAGGIIENISISGNNELIIEWENGTTQVLQLPDPVTGISSVTGNVTGGNLTITFYFTNGTTHSFTCALTGMATTSYVNGLDAQNVKLTGAQTVEGVKTFSDSPVVPDTPATEHSAVNQDWAENVVYQDDTVNNLVHKEGEEFIGGRKKFTNSMEIRTNGEVPFDYVETDIDITDPTYKVMWGTIVYDTNNVFIGGIGFEVNTDGRTRFFAQVRNADGTAKIADIVAGDP